MIVSDVASPRYVARGVYFLYSDLLYPSAEDGKGRETRAPDSVLGSRKHLTALTDDEQRYRSLNYLIIPEVRQTPIQKEAEEATQPRPEHGNAVKPFLHPI